ncbi:MAG: 3-hydroxybutyryl-CoA dehydrogenase [Burkholderiales bacterium]|nr:3-hydroxybutyryl-CoA dehydrogenase [Burkholderiales bacterium]
MATKKVAKKVAKPVAKRAVVGAAHHERAVIGALGAGRMGRGIAHAFAFAGHEVWLIDVKARSPEDAKRLEKEARAEVKTSLQLLASLKAFDRRAIPKIMARVHFAALADAPSALKHVDVLFEGVPETMAAKRAGLAYACRHLRANAIIASTTSTFLVTDVAKFVTRPQRFLNGHWLNPAFLIPLVEVSPHAGTSPAVLRRFRALLESVGKEVALCKPAPGFIVPRLQSLIMSEAARMVEEGTATPEDIDHAVRYGFGFRYANMGPVEFIDFGGLDILHYANLYLSRTLGKRYRAPAIIGRYMQEGRRGLREGRGFYDWRKVDTAAYRKATLGRMVAMLRFMNRLPAPR